ncbi:DNA gyrase inhibitor YacG [Blastopirellula retiformator]|uniref:Zinc-binding protein n=1 Tax=Blastopirellula retiformator TaxID=2527970 RepID=A0A5C5UU97_9BACT|nr:DNA gyrase inhibitor YacG [Blastopirellula retiformator]TWT29856.1 zinc-binding protein [Blastopirellula retiformator]
MKCPTCETEFEEPTKSMPFCSERCRQIDLGSWLGESYSMPVDIDRRLSQLAGEIPEDEAE